MPLRSRLPQIAAQLKPTMDRIVKETADEVAQDAKGRVPVASGDLREAIHVDDRGDMTYAVVAGDKDTFYGHFVEFGTVHSPAQPFLIPALEAARPKAVSRAKRALKGL